MRVLIAPLFTYPGNLAADSNYIVVRNLIRALPDWWHVYLAWPEYTGIWQTKAISDELDEKPNVTRVQTPIPSLYRAQECQWDPEMLWRFSPQQGQIPVEVVISTSPTRTITFANAYSIRCGPHERPLIVNWDLLVRDDRQQYMKVNDAEMVAVTTGYAMADLNVHGSPMMRWMAERMVKKLLAPSEARRVINDGEMIFVGVPGKAIDKAIEGVPKRERFGVFYGGRFGQVKRVDDIAEVYDNTFRFGREMDIVMCTGSLSYFRRSAFTSKFPGVELHVGTNQQDAWKLMAGCHATVCYSRSELIASMIWEAMFAGMPVLVQRNRWVNDLLPADYPFWFDTKLQCGALLRMLYEHWRETGEMHPLGAEWGAWARERYDSDDLMAEQWALIGDRVAPLRRQVLEGFDKGVGRSMVELVDKVIEPGMTWTALITALKKNADTKRNYVGNRLEYPRSNSLLDAYRACLYLGWRDDVTQKEPVWVR